MINQFHNQFVNNFNLFGIFSFYLNTQTITTGLEENSNIDYRISSLFKEVENTEVAPSDPLSQISVCLDGNLVSCAEKLRLHNNIIKQDSLDQQLLDNSMPTTQLSFHASDRLGEATSQWMQRMSNKDPNNMREGIWYPNEHFLKSKKMDQKLFEFLNKKAAYIRGYLNKKYFDYINDKGPNSNNVFNGKRIMHFLLKKEAEPSVALNSFLEGLFIVDCGVAVQIARYGALLELLGKDKFNILFGNSSKGQRMNLGYLIDDELQPMQYFVNFTTSAMKSGLYEQINGKKAPKDLVGTIGNRPVNVGQIVEFKGVVTHKYKHPWSADGGYNVVCTDSTPGHQLYMALGFEKPKTEEEIIQLLINSYNRQPTWEDKPEDLKDSLNQALSLQYANSIVSKLDPKKGEGFNSGSQQDFNYALIQELIDMPLNKVSMSFVKKHITNDPTYQQQQHQILIRNIR